MGALQCVNCGWQVGLGPPACLVWRTLDSDGAPLKDGARDIDFSEAAVDIFIDSLKLFELKEELDEYTLPLYQKFVSQNKTDNEIPAEKLVTTEA